MTTWRTLAVAALAALSFGGVAKAAPIILNGNDTEANVSAAVGTTVTLYGKSDDNPGLFAFTPDDIKKAFEGTFDILDNSIFVNFVVVKASTQFAIYTYQPGINFGTWTTAGLVNNGGNQPTLSHLSFYIGAGGGEPGGGGEEPGDGGGLPVPEPGALGLIGLGIAAVGLRRRKAA